jgi:hypothetical protein
MQNILDSPKVLDLITDPFFLKWCGPYSFIESEGENVFTCSLAEKKGVYLFTIPFEGKYLVYYVGETGASFANRLLQHVQSYLNGFYRIFDPEEFAKGKKVLLWGGMWKTDRREPKLICDFINEQAELAPKIIKFIGQFRIFLAPIDENKRIIERIESEIARSLIQQSGFIGDFQDNDIRYRPTKPNEQKFRAMMTFPKSIMGLSEELLV